VNLSVVHAAERDRELVADLATERAGLREPEMMGARRLPPADKAGLQGDELEMFLVAVASRFADRQHALVEATTEVAARALFLAGVPSRIIAAPGRGCRLGATNQWQIHSGLDAHNEVITLQNSAAVHASDFLFI
jgi:hypothetical protein